MSKLDHNNIKSELSYAWLHAVASRASVICHIGNRHDDNAGVDARLTGWPAMERYVGRHLSEVDVNVQLKATAQKMVNHNGLLSYSLSNLKHYNDLRSDNLVTPRILVVLFLPKQQQQWLEVGNDGLLLRQCAYWVSLLGAKPSTNQSRQTVYLPVKQRFDPPGLTTLITQLAYREPLLYQEPP
ncbi:MAG: DUF4365 domain-containing protein [Magnetococcales bacterium]|nr:DUF4365 domain-containing protein [Magnetococcales bacterium]